LPLVRKIPARQAKLRRAVTISESHSRDVDRYESGNGENEDMNIDDCTGTAGTSLFA
jgi:hypothetical protein